MKYTVPMRSINIICLYHWSLCIPCNELHAMRNNFSDLWVKIVHFNAIQYSFWGGYFAMYVLLFFYFLRL